jgi:hypothetical protein
MAKISIITVTIIMRKSERIAKKTIRKHDGLLGQDKSIPFRHQQKHLYTIVNPSHIATVLKHISS